ncbi:hypothetical protein ACI65C_005861 [Semiaphis heraclei]
MGWVQSADDDLLPLIIYTHVCTDRTYCGSGRCAPSAKTTEIRPQDEKGRCRDVVGGLSQEDSCIINGSGSFLAENLQLSAQPSGRERLIGYNATAIS